MTISIKRSIFGIDPGTNAMGVCWVDPFGKAQAVGVIKRPRHLKAGTDPLIVSKEMAALVWEWCLKNSPSSARVESQLVIERQAIYSKEQQKADPMDILKLAYLTGALSSYFDQIRSYEPRQWKGQAPKEAIEARMRNKLSPTELRLLDAVKWDDNAVEAVAIVKKFLDAR